MTAKAITGSLARLDVKIEAPPLPIAPLRPSKSETVLPRAGRETRGRSATQPGRRYVGVTLSQLIAAGILKAPLALFHKYKGRQMDATLLADGKVQFGGKTYDSCSQAAKQACSTVPGPRMKSPDGWTFWRYDDGGVKRELAYARQQFLGGK